MMSLRVSQNIPNYNYQYKPQAKRSIEYTPSFAATKKQETSPEKKGSLFKFLNGLKTSNPQKRIHTAQIHTVPKPQTKTEIGNYRRVLATGINQLFDTNVSPENLSCIMSPDEFKEILPTLKEDNFKSTFANQKDGTYFIDLDYKTNYTGGKDNIFDLIENLKEVSSYYNADAGKPFIFAITDNDSLDSIQQILRIIAEDKDQDAYKNLKIIPAVKLSFAHEAPTSNIGYENSELLVYGINPFDENLMKLVETLSQKRKKMIIEFVEKVASLYPEFAYNILEFAEQNKLTFSRDYAISNLYWRAREYAETKGDIAIKNINIVPEKILKEASAILNSLDQILIASAQNTIPKYGSLLDRNSDINIKIKEVFDEYSTHKVEDTEKLVSTAENVYPEIVECFEQQEQKPIMAISAPYYLTHFFEGNDNGEYPNVVKFLELLKKESNGMLCAFESVSPKYNIDFNLDETLIENFNKYIREHAKDFYEVGGSFANSYGIREIIG